MLTADEKRQRQSLVIRIKELNFQPTIEEVAYTWFNRFVALRFMEVNDYLPSHVRVFSDASGSFNPEILKDVLNLDLDGLDQTKVSELLNASQTEELYRYLLLTQCNALNAVLPEMFEKLDDYTEMLLPNNILKPDSILAHLVKDIPEEDFQDAVQIIGWMYQYYNTEPKQAVFDGLKKNIKITKETLPAATQLFTPDWIVRYMVENSLGRLWLESRPKAELKANWKYYLDEAEQAPEVTEKLQVLRSQSQVKSPEDIRLIDPCMGSGHILVYAFDVLMQIYESEGYNPKDAAKLILEKNIFGLDIDRRAYQLAYFALMMKARKVSRLIFGCNARPQVYCPTGFPDGEEYGSLAKVDDHPPRPQESIEPTLLRGECETSLNAWNFKRLLAQKYDVVVTNPPYMGSLSMNSKLSDFLKKHYPDSKSDLFAAFIEKCSQLLKPTGYQAMITQHAWMFLSSYEELRRKLLFNDIVNMIHLGARAFEEIGGQVVQTTAFVLSKRHTSDFKATYARLVDYNSQQAKEEAFLSGQDRYAAKNENFAKIPGGPVAYWASDSMLKAFEYRLVADIAAPKAGLATGNNTVYQRLWYEISFPKIGFGYTDVLDTKNSPHKWYPCDSGGYFRKWSANNEYVVNWENDGQELKNLRNAAGKLAARPQNTKYFFKRGLTWNKLSSSRLAVKYKEKGSIFDDTSRSAFPNAKNELNYLIGLLCSCVSFEYLKSLNPTMSFTNMDIKRIPYIFEAEKKNSIDNLVNDNISLSRTDGDAFETSWDFKRHPLICGQPTIAASFAKWENEAAARFNTLKSNEEELNRLFIDIYNLNGELSPEVSDKEVTVRRAALGREIRSLISYAAGCMFGRYSLDKEGLVYAGGDWNAGQYRSFIPAQDNIIPIGDYEYFEGDIVGRFADFIKAVYGVCTLEENLKFIAGTLGGSDTPREVIRNYFLSGFYADHCKIYQKRPIYWLFDSGKKNGFKALIYLHRYRSDLLAKLRTDYVHEQQERYRTQLTHIASALNNATGLERAGLLTKQSHLTEQAKEISLYEENLHHLADQKITINLDDGVKKNYEIFASVLAKI